LHNKIDGRTHRYETDIMKTKSEQKLQNEEQKIKRGDRREKERTL